ncbi:hypothetical protein BDW71DRAFT_217075 [Aspergillus fruticulosus]
MFFASAHAETDEETLFQFIEENPFGMLITGIESSRQDFLQCTHVPFVLDLPGAEEKPSRPQLRAHIAKQNPQARALLELADGTLPNIFPLERDVLVVFNGRHDHYVTPKFYTETKPTTGKVVPTWNYSAVQVYGKLSLYYDSKTPEAGTFLAKQMHDLSELCERRIMGFTGGDRPQPWKVADAPERYIQLMQRNIVGLQIEITKIEGKFKMSQEMGPGDRNGVARGFAIMGGETGQAISALIQKRGELVDKKKALKNNRPAPPRPKRTNIIRSRNGCKGCRNRRTKCDEQKPTCGTCARLGKDCEYVPLSFKFQVVTVRDSKPSPLPASDEPSDKTTGTLAGDRSIIRSLQMTERDIFYTTYWEDSCIPALHPIFLTATSLAADYPILSEAILALSACNIGRLHAEPKATSTEPMCPLSPSLIHQTRSHLYYSSAIQKLTAMRLPEYRQRAVVIPIVLILFAHLEQAMGIFEGFYCHVRGIMSLEWHEGPDDVVMKSLLSSWMQIRYVVWWARAYFSSLEVCQQLPPIPLPSSLLGVPQTLYDRRVKVLSIMCESHRLNFSVVLQHFRDLRSKEANLLAINEIQAYCTALLREEAAKLEAWVSQLPPCEQPIYGLSETNSAPIRFHSHDAALNYAYYVVARIMQCTGVFRHLCSPEISYHERGYDEETYWVQKLIHIAHWSDMHTSLTKNSYTIGFSGLLLAAILRCRSLPMGLQIQDWLQTLINLQPT